MKKNDDIECLEEMPKTAKRKRNDWEIEEPKLIDQEQNKEKRERKKKREKNKE